MAGLQGQPPTTLNPSQVNIPSTGVKVTPDDVSNYMDQVIGTSNSNEVKITPDDISEYMNQVTKTPANFNLSFTGHNVPGFSYNEMHKHDLGISSMPPSAFNHMEDFYSSQQSSLNMMAKFVPRIATKVAGEIFKMPGYFFGLGAWGATGFDVDEMGKLVDNSYLSFWNKAENTVDQKLFPVYTPDAVKNGTIWKSIISPSFWTTQGADGMGFMLAALFPGQLLRMTGITTKALALFTPAARVAKPFTEAAEAAGKAGETIGDIGEAERITQKFLQAGKEVKMAKVASRINDVHAVVANTVYEASSEASDTYNKMIQSGADKTAAGHAAVSNFLANLVLLFPDNTLEQKWLFSAFGGQTWGASTKAGEELSQLIERTLASKKLTTDNFKSVIEKEFAGLTKARGLTTALRSEIPTAIITEGPWEEGMQWSTDYYFEQRYKGLTKKGIIPGLISSYAKGVSSSLDFQQSVFLGSFLGSLMGTVAGVREAKERNEFIFGQPQVKPEDIGFIGRLVNKRVKPGSRGFAAIMQDNLTNRYKFKDAYEYTVDNEGNKKLVLDKNGKPMLDYHKLFSMFNDKALGEINKAIIDAANARGKKEAFKFAKMISDFNDMFDFFQVEGGMSLLGNHIDALAKADARFREAQWGVESPDIQILSDELRKEAKEFKKIYDDITLKHSVAGLGKIRIMPIEGDKITGKDVNLLDEFLNNNLLHARFSNALVQRFIVDRMKSLNAEKIRLMEGYPEDQIDNLTSDAVEKVNNINTLLKSYGDQLNKTKIKNKQLYNSSDIQDAYEDFIKDKRKFKKTEKKQHEEYVKEKIDNAITPEEVDNIVTEAQQEEENKSVPPEVASAQLEALLAKPPLSEEAPTSTVKPKYEPIPENPEKGALYTEPGQKPQVKKNTGDEVAKTKAEENKVATMPFDNWYIAARKTWGKPGESWDQVLGNVQKTTGIYPGRTPEDFTAFKADHTDEVAKLQDYIDNTSERDKSDRNQNIVNAANRRKEELQAKVLSQRLGRGEKLTDEQQALVNKYRGVLTIDTAKLEKAVNNEHKDEKKLSNAVSSRVIQNTTNEEVKDKSLPIVPIAHQDLDTNINPITHKIEWARDKNGNPQLHPDADPRTMLPNYWKAGDKVVIYMDKKGSTESQSSFAVSLYDEYGKKKSTFHLHTRNWFNRRHLDQTFAAKQTQMYREKIFNGGPLVATIKDKKGGYLSRNLNFKRLSDILPDDIVDHVFFGTGTLSGTVHLGSQFKGNLFNSYNQEAGVPYMVFQLPEGRYFATFLRPTVLSRDNEYLYTKYIQNVQRLIEDYEGHGAVTQGWNLEQLLKEINKFFYVSNIYKRTNLPHQSIFNLHEDKEGNLYMEVSNPDFTSSYPYLTYAFQGGKLYHTNYKNKTRNEVSLRTVLKEGLASKYANVVNEHLNNIGTKEDQNFYYYDVNEQGQLAQTKGSYYNFIKGILQTDIDPIKVGDSYGFSFNSIISLQPISTALPLDTYNKSSKEQNTVPEVNLEHQVQETTKNVILTKPNETANTGVQELIDISNSKKKSPYFAKDVSKFKNANKLIAYGEPNTSSKAYAEAVNPKQLNTGKYSDTDIVGVTVNGGQKSKLDVPRVENELSKAVKGGSTIITDAINDRKRSYNSGEREIAKYLRVNGYEEINGNGIWKSKQNVLKKSKTTVLRPMVVRPKTKTKIKPLDKNNEPPKAFDLRDRIEPSIDYNNTVLGSFLSSTSYEEQRHIVQSLTHQVIKLYNEAFDRGENLSLGESINKVLGLFQNDYNFFSQFTSVEPDEQSIANGAYATSEENAIIAGNIKYVLDNFEITQDPEYNIVNFVGFRNLIKMELGNLNFKLREGGDILDTEDDVFEKRNYIEDANVRTDPEKSLSARIRRMLYFIPKVDEDGNYETDSLGLPVYYNYVKTFNSLMFLLSDVPMEDMEQTLKDASQVNPLYTQVLNELNKQAEVSPELQNNFYSVFRKQSTHFKILLYYPTNQSWRTIDANRRSASSIIAEQWNSAFVEKAKKMGLLKKQGTSFVVDKKIAQGLEKEFNTVFKTDALTDKTQILHNVLSKIGIDMSPEVLQFLEEERIRSLRWRNNNRFLNNFGTKNIKTTDDFINNSFGYIFRALSGKLASRENVTEDWQKNNPFYTQAKIINALAFYQLLSSPSVFNSSFRGADNELRYAFVNPHMMSDTMAKLQNADYINSLLKVPFYHNSLWLKALLSDQSTFKNNFRLFYFDASRGRWTHSEAKDFDKQNDLEKELTRISLLMNNGEDSGIFFTNVPSDKKTFTMIQANRIKSDLTNDVFDDGEINVNNIPRDSKVVKALYSTVQGELERINEVVKEYYSLPIERQIEGYHYIYVNGKRVLGAGAYIFSLPQLNDLVSRSSEGYITTSEDTMVEHTLNVFMNLVYDKLNTWDKLGVINYKQGTTKIDDRYVQQASRLTGRNKKSINILNHMAFDYVLNTMIAQSNMSQIFTGDPAFFSNVKQWDGKWESLVQNTITNYFKRTAKDIAPGMEGRHEEEHKDVKYLILNEPKGIGRELSHLKDKFGAMGLQYTDIDSADSEEWTTAEEHINTLYSYGRLTTKERDDIIDKLKHNQDLDERNMRLTLQPEKPVNVGTYTINGVNAIIPAYIKTSAFPLLPQITRNNPQLDLFRRTLEAHADRAVVKSGVKLGYRNALNLFDENGDIRMDINPDDETINDNVMVLGRTGLKIQQEIPARPYHHQILEGSQDRKLRYSDIPVGTTFNLHGTTLSAPEMEKMDSAIHTELYKRRLSDLADEILAYKDPNGDYKIRDVNGLKSMMIKEALARGYALNDVLMLSTVQHTNGTSTFSIPLFFHPANEKMEALLNSIITNGVLKNRIEGLGYTQASSVGFKHPDKVTMTEDILREITGGQHPIFYTKEYDGEGLKYSVKKDPKTGEDYIEAQIIIPFPFQQKDADGNVLYDEHGYPLRADLKDYLKADGTLDDTKFDTRLLDGTGYRIPTSGMPSIVKTRVVGFLPSIMSDIAVVPSEMVKEMGSDFDADKLWTHQYNYGMRKDGELYKLQSLPKIVKDKRGKHYISNLDELSVKELENLLLDMNISILKNSDTATRELQLTDNDRLSKIEQHINNLKSKTKVVAPINHLGLNMSDEIDSKDAAKSSYLYDGFQNHMIDVNEAGKFGTAIMASQIASHASSQHGGVYLRAHTTFDHGTPTRLELPILFKKNNGTLYEDNPADPDFNTNRVISVEDANYNMDETPSGAWRLDKILTFPDEGGNREHISDILRNIITEAVDNAKNQRLYGLGLNSNTLHVASLLARSGIYSDLIEAFINQPVIHRFVDDLSNTNNFFDTTITRRNTIMENLFNKYVEESGLKRSDIGKPIAFSLKELENMIVDGRTTTKEQLYALQNFINYTQLAMSLAFVNRATNVDTAFLGSNFASTLRWIDDVDRVENLPYININKLLDNTTKSSAIEYGLYTAQSLFGRGDISPINSNIYQSLIDNVIDQLSPIRERINLTEDRLRQVNNAIRSACYSASIYAIHPLVNNEFVSMDEMRKALLFDTKNSKSLGTEVEEFKQKSNNLFINSLFISPAYDEVTPRTIEYNGATAVNTEVTNDLSFSWLDLLSKPEDSEEYQIGFKLLQYAMLLNNNRTARSFSRFIPPDVIKKFGIADFLQSAFNPNHVLVSNNVEVSLSELLEKHFYEEFVRHNPYQTKPIDMDHQVQAAMDVKGKSIKGNRIVPFRIVLKNLSDENMVDILVHNQENAQGITVPSFVHMMVNNQIYLYKLDPQSLASPNPQYQLISQKGDSQHLLDNYSINNTIAQREMNLFDKNYNKVLQQAQLRYKVKDPGLNVAKQNMATAPKRETTGDVFSHYEIAKGDINNSLSIVEKNAPNKSMKAITQIVEDKMKDIPNVKVDIYDANNPFHTGKGTLFPNPIGRTFTDKQNKSFLILTNPKRIDSSKKMNEVLIHESFHVLYNHALWQIEEGKATKLQEDAYNNIQEVYSSLKNNNAFMEKVMNKFNSIYPMESVHEFVSHALSNRTMQDLLQNEAYDEKHSILHKILDYILKVMGLDIKPGTALYNTYASVFTLLDVQPEDFNTKPMSTVEEKTPEIAPKEINKPEVKQVTLGKGNIILDLNDNLLEGEGKNLRELADMKNISEYLRMLPAENRRTIVAANRKGTIKIKCK